VVGSQIDVDIQAVFQHMQIFVARAKQGLDVRAEFNAFLHSGLWRCLLQPGGPASILILLPRARVNRILGIRIFARKECL